MYRVQSTTYLGSFIRIVYYDCLIVWKGQINGWKIGSLGWGVFSKDTLYNGAGVGQVPTVPAVLVWEIIGCESVPELGKVLRVRI